jgi:hypothetical protein
MKPYIDALFSTLANDWIGVSVVAGDQNEEGSTVLCCAVMCCAMMCCVLSAVCAFYNAAVVLLLLTPLIFSPLTRMLFTLHNGTHYHISSSLSLTLTLTPNFLLTHEHCHPRPPRAHPISPSINDHALTHVQRTALPAGPGAAVWLLKASRL